MESEVFKWAVTQGGLVLVLIVIIWAYRRDLTRIQLKDEEKTNVLIDLVRDVTLALQELRDLIRTASQQGKP